MKISFRNDYGVLAHPRMLKALSDCMDETNLPYGLDIHSDNAKKLIKERFELENTNIHFVTGGTQANLLVISAFLKDYEAVISCDSGHINVHETGAIESTGHKIITVKNIDGKLTVEEVKKALDYHKGEHMVKPKMLYISNSTESGTIYKKDELIKLRKLCDEHDLYLFLDGARLASALTCSENDVEINMLGKICDAFYIGGTKNGLLSGEAIVIPNPKLDKEFRYHIKNKGAMIAKGFVLGIQFEEAFKDDLYFELAKHSNKMAQYIKDNLKDVKYFIDSPTNQLFMEFDKDVAAKLVEKYDCEVWQENENSTVIRIVTSFMTTLSQCDLLIKDIKKIM